MTASDHRPAHFERRSLAPTWRSRRASPTLHGPLIGLIFAHGRALPPGGAFIAIEALIDDARRENAFGLLMSPNLLVEFGDAFDYSGADFAGWCKEAGFKDIQVLPLAGPSSAAVAYK